MPALQVKPKLASGVQNFPATTGAWANSDLVAESLKKTTAANDDLASGPALDEETGLYYYGARYYDPRTSVWQSVDPKMPDYLGNDPRTVKRRRTGTKDADGKLSIRGDCETFKRF